MTAPVFTTENDCQDCYKCVRHCPVKAIRVEGGKASVIPEACVACGQCVKVCPAHAKKIRDDFARLKALLSSGGKVYASVAPSFAGYFPGVTIGQLAAALEKAGFAGVSETAHGAQAVSASVTKLLEENTGPLIISSACPACVDMVRKYLPDYASTISPLPSPIRAHCRLLRDKFGEDIKVVFFGPCAAKKNEADTHPDELALAVVFPALEKFLNERHITFDEEAELALGPAAEGRFYSVEGGMNDTLRGVNDNVRFVSVSGLGNLRRLLGTKPPAVAAKKIFVEALACPGGCVNGPAMPRGASGLATLFATDAEAPIRPSAESSGLCNREQYRSDTFNQRDPGEEEIASALARVGKTTKSDELNCGACGYGTCREFARALLEGKAEETMCHNWLRKNFERTSNALIKYIPAGVVIVDGAMSVTECNRHFASLVSATDIFDALGNLEGVAAGELLPEFADLLEGALEHGAETSKFHQHFRDKIVNISVFPVSRGKAAGAVIQDVTKNEFRREQVAEKAREVIRKNVYTVQEVARLFGEHIAETEIMLAEIAGTYESETPPESNGAFLSSGGFN